MTNEIYVVIKQSEYQESLDEWASGERNQALYQTAQKFRYEGTIPVPKNWKIEGEEAFHFMDIDLAQGFVKELLTSSKRRYIDFATMIDPEQIERRIARNKGLLARLFRK
jgi:hypothetical protein